MATSTKKTTTKKTATKKAPAKKTAAKKAPAKKTATKKAPAKKTAAKKAPARKVISEDMIRVKAQELWESGHSDSDVENWLEAERQLKIR